MARLDQLKGEREVVQKKLVQLLKERNKELVEYGSTNLVTERAIRDTERDLGFIDLEIEINFGVTA